MIIKISTPIGSTPIKGGGEGGGSNLWEPCLGCVWWWSRVRTNDRAACYQSYCGTRLIDHSVYVGQTSAGRYADNLTFQTQLSYITI